MRKKDIRQLQRQAVQVVGEVAKCLVVAYHSHLWYFHMRERDLRNRLENCHTYRCIHRLHDHPGRLCHPRIVLLVLLDHDPCGHDRLLLDGRNLRQTLDLDLGLFHLGLSHPSCRDRLPPSSGHLGPYQHQS